MLFLAHLLADRVDISPRDLVWSGHICTSVKEDKNKVPKTGLTVAPLQIKHMANSHNLTCANIVWWMCDWMVEWEAFVTKEVLEKALYECSSLVIMKQKRRDSELPTTGHQGSKVRFKGPQWRNGIKAPTIYQLKPISYISMKWAPGISRLSWILCACANDIEMYTCAYCTR